MKFEYPLIPAALIKRYKRFLADVRLESGETLTVHCPNPGSMRSCQQEGWPVMLSDSRNPKRKLRYTWEMVNNGRSWIGINTHRANTLAKEALEQGKIPELSGFDELRTEVKYGKNSRIDILLRFGSKFCYVEVKSVTLLGNNGDYQFPDSVTERGRKHLAELVDMIHQGHRAVMLYIIQREDGQQFGPAWEIDPAYAQSLVMAHAQGVEILPYRTQISPQEITVIEPVGFDLKHV